MARRVSAARVLGLLLSSAFLYAQEFRATLTGRVLDTADAPVANVKLQVNNAATGEVRAALTDSHGNYIVPLLNPGSYSVRAEAEGFKAAIQKNVELTVNQTATLDLRLELFHG